jgi:hypothetical protein
MLRVSVMDGRGLYRIKDGWHQGEDSVVLGSDSGLTVEISEHDYRSLGYKPALDDLAWGATVRRRTSHTIVRRREGS